MIERLACLLPIWPSQDLEVEPQKLPEIDLDTVPMTEMPEEDVDSLSEYTFPKFAVTYFQKSASHTHIQKPLRYPLLYHEDDTDHLVQLFSGFYVAQPPPHPQSPNSELLFRENRQRKSPVTMGPSAGTNHVFCLILQAALAVWTIILRFMGDLPEPMVYARNSLSGSSVVRLGKESGSRGPQHNRSAQVCGKGGRQVSTKKDPES